MNDLRWWQSGVIYQVYPRSFMDANGDGVGDLRGVEERLDHLTWLGVDALWLSPIFPSPMVDFGYDVADYTGIDPRFGSLADFDRLLRAAHTRGLKVILDFVPNHTSDQHPWFQEARCSRTNPKRDWYLWRDPAPDGGLPNNWISNFGGTTWQWDERTGQYYYHAFHRGQPDLNWRNPQVRRAMLDVMRFWFERGVDGFRIDVLWHLIKDAQFRDNPPNPNFRPGMPEYRAVLQRYSTDRPEVFDVVAQLRAVADEYRDRVLIGEIYLPIERLVAYYGEANDGVHLPFNFQLVTQPWHARTLAAIIEQYEAALPPGGWPNWVLGNHDKPRLATRVGAAQTRVAALLLLTLRGTPTLYYGEEIGMRDVPIPPELTLDPQGKGMPGVGMERDPVRTPMQWDAAPHAGFTHGQPWLPLAPDYPACNVARQRDDPASLLCWYRDLIALRRSEPAFVSGSYAPVAAEADVLAYLRASDQRRFLVALNLADAPAQLKTPSPEGPGRVVMSTDHQRQGDPVTHVVELGANEGVIVQLGS